MCPLYYVEHEDAWEAFRDDVALELELISTESNERT